MLKTFWRFFKYQVQKSFFLEARKRKGRLSIRFSRLEISSSMVYKFSGYFRARFLTDSFLKK